MDRTFPNPQFFEFRGRKLAYYTYQATGEHVLWLHANGYSALTYHPLLLQMQKAGYQVHALDFLGHGASAGEAGDITSWNDFRDQILALMDHLALERSLAVGHSIGGATASLAAAQDGARRIRGVTMLDPVVVTPFLSYFLQYFENPLAVGAEKRRRVFKSLKIVARSFRMNPGFRDWD